MTDTPSAKVSPDNVHLLRTAFADGSVDGAFLPAVFVLELTNRCNVNCIMCPNSRFPDAALGDISVEVFTQCVRQIAPVAELVMLYFLGEPTLHPQFADLLRIARRELRGTIVVSTNAFAMDDDIVRALVESTDVVIACIDRWNENAYDRTRRGSSFLRVVASVERLLAARGSKAAPIVVTKTLDINLPSDAPEQVEVEERAFVSFWRERGAIPLSGWLNTWAGQLPQLTRLSRRTTPYHDLARTPCADLWFKMVINWRGEVAMCCHNWDSSIVMGSLVSSTVAGVWHSAAIAELRRNHQARHFHCNALCDGCREWAEPEELDCYLRLLPSDLHRVF